MADKRIQSYEDDELELPSGSRIGDWLCFHYDGPRSKRQNPDADFTDVLWGGSDGKIIAFNPANRTISVVFPQEGRANQTSIIDLKRGQDLTFSKACVTAASAPIETIPRLEKLLDGADR